ncbi:MAG: type II toxin-antitoxin system VapC family toxin [Thermoleophilia bacterium]|nr:type II toxin-antitoxin system VapC family toxin [Thermoleophilia bacterium]
MTFLLDTHTWLWLVADPERLARETREMLADQRADVRLSIGSIWEISIKYGIGRLTLPAPPGEYLPLHLARQQLVVQPIELDHVLRVATLPMHHKDPFDRMLVAQAQALRATIVTADVQIARYDVDVLDVR